jgi:outer membrane protein assembly factor BamB
MKSLTFALLLIPIISYGQESSWRYHIDSASIFSSPRFCDLNNDGVKDIVIGAGIENVPTQNGIVAINGKSGKLLWQVPTRTQIYTSALFQDITNDGIPEVFIGGRAASYYAINGANGEIIWQFFEGTDSESRQAGFLNFFGTQFTKDEDGDGFKDLLVTNGGDYLAKADETKRQTARLMVLSSQCGKIIHSARMPEERESYYAPHIICEKGKPTVIFGTGGETIDGSLWKVPYSSLVKGDLKKAKRIIRDGEKGFILNSVMADINADGRLDILNARMDGTISAVDGKKNKVIWQHVYEERECYVTPTLGYFAGNDSIPDFFTIIAEGTFPIYKSFELIVINGATGELAFRKKAGVNQFSPAVAADVNNDGVDEIIFLENTMVDPEKFSMENRIHIIDIKNNSSSYIGPSRPGLSMASAPGIVDLDNDGDYEIVVATTAIAPESTGEQSIIECIHVEWKLNSVTWGGYLGPQENGLLK